MADLQAARTQLLRELGATVRDQRVLDALAAVPRERFVPPELYSQAYDNSPLPIGEGQTISQPLIVAVMSEALEAGGDERVLEIGTGSGYQAAVLSHLVRDVVSVERFPDLAARARRVLDSLGITNVAIHPAGDVLGYPEGAPYDAVIVTAAAPYVPQALLSQVRDGGRIIIPVGTLDQQELLVVTRRGDGIRRRSLGGCRFVPLIGAEAWPPEGDDR